jgi:hypothetical protein
MIVWFASGFLVGVVSTIGALSAWSAWRWR